MTTINEIKVIDNIIQDMYKLNIIVSHNSELSNYVEQPLDKDVLLFSGTNAIGKSSKLNFYKYMLTPELNFKEIKKKINTDKDKPESFKHYFPADNSFWISEHENDSGVFCQILVRNEAKDYEVKRLFVPVVYDVVRTWLFNDDNSSTKITKKELIEFVKKSGGIESTNVQHLRNLMFGNDNKCGERYNVVCLKSMDLLDDFKYFFDVFSGGIGDKDLVRKLFIKKVDTALTSQKSKKEDETIDYKSILKDLRRFSEEIKSVENKARCQPKYDNFKDVIKNRSDLSPVFFEAPNQVNKLKASIKTANNKRNKEYTNKESLSETINDIKQTKIEYESDLKHDAISHDKDKKNINEKYETAVQTTQKLNNQELENEESKSKTERKAISDKSEQDIKDLETKHETDTKTKKEAFKHSVDKLNTALASDEAALSKDEENEINNDDKAKDFNLKLSNLKTEKIEKISILSNYKNKRIKEISDDISVTKDNFSDLKDNNAKDINELTQKKINDISLKNEEKTKLISEMTGQANARKEFNSDFVLIENNIKKSLDTYNIYFEKSYKIEDKDSVIEHIKEEQKNREQVLSGIVPVLNQDNFHNAQLLVQNNKVLVETLKNEISLITNPLTLSDIDQKYFYILEKVLNQSYTEVEYLNEKEKFVKLLSNFEVSENNEIFFVGKSFGFLREIIEHRDIEVVNSEFNQENEKTTKLIENLTSCQQKLQEQKDNIEKIKGNKEIAKKELDIITRTLNAWSEWRLKDKEKYEQNKCDIEKFNHLETTIINEHKIDVDKIEADFKVLKNGLIEKLDIETKRKDGIINELKKQSNTINANFEGENKKIEKEYQIDKNTYTVGLDSISSKIKQRYEDKRNILKSNYKIEKERLELEQNNFLIELVKTLQSELKTVKLKTKELLDEMVTLYEEKIKTLKELHKINLSDQLKERDLLLKTQNDSFNKKSELLKNEIKALGDKLDLNEKKLKTSEVLIKTLISDIDTWTKRITIIEKKVGEERLIEIQDYLEKNNKLKDVEIDNDYLDNLIEAEKKETDYNNEILKMTEIFEKENLIDDTWIHQLKCSGMSLTRAIKKLSKYLDDLYYRPLEEVEAEIFYDFQSSRKLLLGYLAKIRDSEKMVDNVRVKINKNFKDEAISNIKGFELEVKTNDSIATFLKIIEDLDDDQSDVMIDSKSLDAMLSKIERGVEKLLKGASEEDIKNGKIKLEHLIENVVPIITKNDGTKEKSSSNGTNTMFNILFAINSFGDLLQYGCGFTMPIIIDEVSKLDPNNFSVALEAMKKVGFKLVCATPTLNQLSGKPLSITDINLSTCFTEKHVSVSNHKSRIGFKSSYFVSNRKDADLSDDLKKQLGVYI